ncbi:hypothetical protein JDS17_20260 [Escherichia coli]|nr:hypothetical protein [Escherichia coli]
MPLLCRRFSSVAPYAALPAHLTVCKATAPDGAAVSACLPPHCGLFSADGLSGVNATMFDRYLPFSCPLNTFVTDAVRFPPFHHH